MSIILKANLVWVDVEMQILRMLALSNSSWIFAHGLGTHGLGTHGDS